MLPASDPQSSVNKANLVATCQKCHANANEKFALGTVHEDKNEIARPGRQDRPLGAQHLPAPHLLRSSAAWSAHNLLILRKKALASLRDPNRTLVRMALAARIQHGLLASSFIVLVISGFALKYPGSGLSWLMGSSELVRRTGHRAAACVMIVGALAHLFYAIFTRNGRTVRLDMLPEAKDLTDVLATLRYYLVPGSPKPQFKRFGYAEKAEYLGGGLGHLPHGRHRPDDLVQALRHRAGARAGSSTWPPPSTTSRRSWPPWPSWSGTSTS